MASKSKVKSQRSARQRKERIEKIFATLDEMFPDATCALRHRNAWELLVATILSAQCTDERVNKVTPELFRKYPTIKDFAAVSQEELAADIRSTGFFNNKAKSLRAAAVKILKDFGGQAPRTMEELTSIPGVARKTANVVLGTAYGIPAGVVVDTHVKRIAKRLDLTRENDPVKIERDLMKIGPHDRWIRVAHHLLLHGRGRCNARNPQCPQLPLHEIC